LEGRPALKGLLSSPGTRLSPTRALGAEPHAGVHGRSRRGGLPNQFVGPCPVVAQTAEDASLRARDGQRKAGGRRRCTEKGRITGSSKYAREKATDRDANARERQSTKKHNRIHMKMGRAGKRDHQRIPWGPSTFSSETRQLSQNVRTEGMGKEKRQKFRGRSPEGTVSKGKLKQ